MPVHVHAPEALGGAHLCLGYEAGVLDSPRATAGDLLGSEHALFYSRPESGRVSVIAYTPEGTDAIAAQPGALFAISFQVSTTATVGSTHVVGLATPGPAEVSASGLSAFDGREIPHTVVPGVLTIVASPPPPDPPSGPGPSDGEEDVPILTSLSWGGAEGALSYDVYVWEGGGGSPPAPVAEDLPTNSYAPLAAYRYWTTYSWQVVAKNPTGVTTGPVWSFTTVPAPPAPPSLMSPDVGAINVPALTTLDWSDSARAYHYDLFLWATTGTKPVTATVSGLGESRYEVPARLDYVTTYSWQVVATNIGGKTAGPEWWFVTAPEPPDPPTAPFPPDGAVDVPLLTAFDWSNCARAETYEMYLWREADTRPDAPTTSGLLQSQCPALWPLDHATTYTWQIVARNPGGVTTGPLWSFVTVPAPPDVPADPTPSDGETSLPVALDLDWADCARASSYDVYFWREGEARPALPTASGLTASSSDSLVGLDYATTYSWQVYATNVTSQTAGPVWTFVTVPQYALFVESQHGAPDPPRGESLYTSGVTVVATVDALVPEGATRHECLGWTGEGSVPPSGTTNSVTVTMDAPSTLTWQWQTWNYFGILPAVGERQGEGWYTSGSVAVWSVVSPWQVTEQFRYVTDVTTGAVLMDSPSTITVSWRPQYLLTVESPRGNPQGTGWYDFGSTAGWSVDSPIYVSPSERWAAYPASGVVTMDSWTTVTVTWKLERYLAVDSPYGDAQGEGWHEVGTSATWSVTSPWAEDGCRRLVADPTSGVVVMAQPTTVTVRWTEQFAVAVDSPLGDPAGAGWYDTGTTACWSVDSPVYMTPVERWVAAPSTGCLVVDRCTTVTLAWYLEYYLTVAPDYGSPVGEGWYDADTTATWSVTSPYNEDGCVQLVTGTTSGAVYMDAPTTVTVPWTGLAYLGVESPRGDPQGAGWREAGAMACWSVTSPVYDSAVERWEARPSSGCLQMDDCTTVTVDWWRQYFLRVDVTNGTANETGWIDEGAGVRLLAEPYAGYHFVTWAGDVPVGHETDNPVDFTMTGPKVITAVIARSTGVIAVEVGPIPAPWTLAGPDGLILTDSGTSTVTEAPTGAYQITWEPVDGWNPPTPSIQSLVLDRDGAGTFTATYARQRGTVVVDVTPDAASWQLVDGDGDTTVGTGDATLAGLPSGEIAVTWLPLPEYDLPTPNPQTQVLADATTVTFVGVYPLLPPLPILEDYVIIYKINGRGKPVPPEEILDAHGRGLTLPPEAGPKDTLLIKLNKRRDPSTAPTSLDFIRTTGGFRKLYTQAFVLELQAAGTVKSLTAKKCRVGYVGVSSGGIGSLRMAAVQDSGLMEWWPERSSVSTTDTTHFPETFIDAIQDSGRPARIRLSGVLLRRLVADWQDIAYVKAATKVMKAPGEGKRLCFGGILRRTDDEEGDILRARRIGMIKVNGGPIAPYSIESGPNLRRVSAVGRSFRIARGDLRPVSGDVCPFTLVARSSTLSLLARGGNICTDISMVSGAIPVIKSQYRTVVAGGLRVPMGGRVGYIPPAYSQGSTPSLVMHVYAGAYGQVKPSPDIRIIHGDLGVFGVFAAGSDLADGQPAPGTARGAIGIVKTRRTIPPSFGMAAQDWWGRVEGKGYSAAPIQVEPLPGMPDTDFEDVDNP